MSLPPYLSALFVAGLLGCGSTQVRFERPEVSSNLPAWPGASSAAYSPATPRLAPTSVPSTSRRPKTRVYYVSDLVRAPRSYPGPRIGLAPSGGLDFEEQEVTETPPVIDEALLLELIRNSIAPGTWDEEGNSIEIRDGKLIVTRR